MLPEVEMLRKIDGFPQCLNVIPKIYFGSVCFLIMLNCVLKQEAPSFPSNLGEDIAKAGSKRAAVRQRGVLPVSFTPDSGPYQGWVV